MTQVMATTGGKLRRFRRAKGLSQRELSKLSGVAQSTIAWIECGKTREPHPKTLAKLSQPLGITPGDLLED